MSLVTVSILSLEETKQFFSESRQKKIVAKEVGIAVLQLHNELRRSILQRYTGNKDINRQRIGKSTSIVTTGKNTISGGLAYKVKAFDVSKFSYTARYGALNKGKGWIHTVEIVKGQRKVLKGKSGRGGFTPRVGSSSSNHGKPKRLYKSGSQMLERTSSRRLPLRVLYAPNTENMINRALEKDKQVNKVLETLELNIIENYI